MPIPNTLKMAVEANGRSGKFDPQGKRDFFTAYEPTWRSYLDLYELDRDKLSTMVDEFVGERPDRLTLRKKLLSVFNFVPTIVDMIRNYLFSTQPAITVPEPLRAFVNNCDGKRSLADYIKDEALPLALVFGFVDTLVQSPAGDEGLFVSRADEASADLDPKLFTITPLVRTNWSCRHNGEYNWIRFVDYDDEPNDPFAVEKPVYGESYVTISRAVEGLPESEGAAPKSFWVRTHKDANDWIHDGGFTPTLRAPIASLAYAWSHDPKRRHFGRSKIATIAMLTRKIIQVLSWADEDVLSNLALFVFPGREPTNPDGTPKPVQLNPWSVVWQDVEAKTSAFVLQGDATHTDLKFKIIDVYVREILRVAHLIGASAESEQIQSGVQGIVARNELFMELSDLAGSLDRYAYEVLALAASLKQNEDVTVDALLGSKDYKVDFNKQFIFDPLPTLIEAAKSLVEMFESISPTLVKTVLKQVAASALYNEDESELAAINNEIDAGFDAMVEQRNRDRAALSAGVEESASGELPANVPPEPAEVEV